MAARWVSLRAIPWVSLRANPILGPRPQWLGHPEGHESSCMCSSRVRHESAQAYGCAVAETTRHGAPSAIGAPPLRIQPQRLGSLEGHATLNSTTPALHPHAPRAPHASHASHAFHAHMPWGAQLSRSIRAGSVPVLVMVQAKAEPVSAGQAVTWEARLSDFSKVDFECRGQVVASLSRYQSVPQGAARWPSSQ